MHKCHLLTSKLSVPNKTLSEVREFFIELISYEGLPQYPDLIESQSSNLSSLLLSKPEYTTNTTMSDGNRKIIDTSAYDFMADISMKKPIKFSYDCRQNNS